MLACCHCRTMPGVWKPCGYRPLLLFRITDGSSKNVSVAKCSFAFSEAEARQVVVVDAELERVVALQQRHVVLELDHVGSVIEPARAAGSRVHRRKGQPRREDGDVGKVTLIVLPRDAC